VSFLYLIGASKFAAWNNTGKPSLTGVGPLSVSRFIYNAREKGHIQQSQNLIRMAVKLLSLTNGKSLCLDYPITITEIIQTIYK
jgi:hypothetical protein